MELFIRYAEQGDFPPLPYAVRAYDDRFLYILSGKGELELEGKRHAIREDCLCYYPAGSRYRLIVGEGERLRFVSVNFDFSRAYEGITQVLPPVPAERYREEERHIAALAPGEDLFRCGFVMREAMKLRELMTAVADEFGSAVPHAERRASALLQYLCYRILDRRKPPEEQLCRRVTGWLEEHYAEKLEIRRLAEVFAYHPNYLGAVFRKGTGMTLHRYIMQLRLRRGAELLKSSSASVAEIAEAVGFENADHFSACFTKRYSIPPTVYRRTELSL